MERIQGRGVCDQIARHRPLDVDSRTMIVGYIDTEGQVYCVECWRSRAKAGAHPREVLDSDDPNDPGTNFWVVDDCSACGYRVKHLSATTLT
jgi:hypothetical protein